jgi:hypothetical protein
MDKSSQLKDVELEVLTFVTHEAREDREEIEYEIASEIVPRGLAQGPVVTIYLEKRQASVDNEENVIDQLKYFNPIIVLWKDQSINRTYII